MANSGARIACAAAGMRSPCPTPPSTRCTPPTETATRAGSTSAPDRPTAARIRPQLGSMPWAAVFTSGEVVIASPARRASSSLAAPPTGAAITLVAPSLLARAGVGVAAVDHHRLGASAPDLLPAHQHRRRLHPVRREAGGRGGRRGGGDERQIGAARLNPPVPAPRPRPRPKGRPP